MRGYSITQALSLPEFKVTQVQNIPDGLRIHLAAHALPGRMIISSAEIHKRETDSV